MSFSRRLLTIASFILILAAVIFGGRWLAAGQRERQIRRLVPELDAEIVHHLVRDDDSHWFAWGRRAGNGRLGTALTLFEEALLTRDSLQFVARRGILERAKLRIVQAQRVVFDFPANERRTRHEMAMSPGREFVVRGWVKQYADLSRDGYLRSAAARIATADSLAALFSANGDSIKALYPAALSASWEIDRGRIDLAIARMEDLAARSRTLGEYYMLCQVLGQLGVIHRNRGEVDSMRACYDEGIAVATRHGFPDQAARLFSFYAGYHFHEGHPAAAFDRLTEAVQLCEQLGDQGARCRMQLEYTKFLAEIENWDLVERSLRKMPPLLRAIPHFSRAIYRSHYEFETGLLQARLAFARHRADEANRRMAAFAETCPPESRRVGMADLLDDWADGLEGAGRLREAAAVCARGIAHCDSANVPQGALHMRICAAEIAAALGRFDEAAARLDSIAPALREIVGHPSWQLEAEVLRARLLARRGRRDGARQRLEKTFAKLLAGLREAHDPGSAVLLQHVALDLRDALCEVQPGSAERSYGFEMEWVSLPRELCRGRRSAAELVDLALHRPRARPPQDGVHLVYRFTQGRLVRWTADRRGVVVDTLDLDADRCLEMVREAVELLQKEPVTAGHAFGPKTEGALDRLARAILPAGLPVSRAHPLRLEVTPDGPLAALPFAALPCACDGARPPLAWTADVAYVQAVEDPAMQSATGGSVLVVSDPEVPRELARRYGLGSELRGAELEADAAIGRWPGASVLSREHATKRAVCAQLPAAEVFYLASHHVRDLDVPLLGFVPMTATARDPPDAAMLETADIHALDLSRCRLAVLASCASGTPYRSAARPGRSFGDAFLEAGAESVVGSFWDVEDADVRVFMRSFLCGWRNEGNDATALGQATRSAIEAGMPARVWAAWAVERVRTAR